MQSYNEMAQKSCFFWQQCKVWIGSYNILTGKFFVHEKYHLNRTSGCGRWENPIFSPEDVLFHWVWMYYCILLSPKVFLCLASPSENGNTVLCQGGCHLVLCWVDVACRPAYLKQIGDLLIKFGCESFSVMCTQKGTPTLWQSWLYTFITQFADKLDTWITLKMESWEPPAADCKNRLCLKFKTSYILTSPPPVSCCLPALTYFSPFSYFYSSSETVILWERRNALKTNIDRQKVHHHKSVTFAFLFVYNLMQEEERAFQRKMLAF